MRNNKFVIIHTIRLLNTNQHAYLKYKAKEIGTYNWKKYKNAMLDDYIKKSANKPKNYKSKCTNRKNKATKKNREIQTYKIQISRISQNTKMISLHTKLNFTDQ